MANQHDRSLSGPGRVVTLPFAAIVQTLAEGGIVVPDQDEMKRMMRGARMGLIWSANQEEIERQERCFPSRRVDFEVFDLDDYLKLAKHVKGAPIPEIVLHRIDAITALLPGSKVKIHALPKEDPFVEILYEGVSFFVAAWLRILDYVDVHPVL